MNTPTHSDQLLHKLLSLGEAAGTEPPEHPCEEMVAGFVADELIGSERTAMIEHLADCSPCRKLVSELLKCEETSLFPTSTRAAPRGVGTWMASFQPYLAAAALVLLSIGGLGYWMANPRLTEAQAYAKAKEHLQRQDYAGARFFVASAKRHGQLSDRLRNLDAQAARRMPHIIALASAGRLSDFGYQIGGVAARAAPTVEEASQLEQSRQVLATASNDEVEVLLNRGHLLLSQGKDTEAAKEFEAAVKLSPKEPLAWLGKGLAAFLQNDLAGAEQAFQRCRELDPQNVAATINLAMTLEEQDRTADAIDVWREMLPFLSPNEHDQVVRHLKQLEEANP